VKIAYTVDTIGGNETNCDSKVVENSDDSSSESEASSQENEVAEEK